MTESHAAKGLEKGSSMGGNGKKVVDRAAIESNWHQRGFSCGLWIDPPGQVWADYVHGTDELVVVVEGDVEFEIDGSRHHSAPGDEIFIPAGARHTVRNLGKVEARWLYGYRR